ncbi:hypothetical protein AB0A67_32660, partial [Streptomyces eurythermus]
MSDGPEASEGADGPDGSDERAGGASSGGPAAGAGRGLGGADGRTAWRKLLNRAAPEPPSTALRHTVWRSIDACAGQTERTLRVVQL